MKAPGAKQNILGKIKQALNKPVPVPFAQTEGGSVFNKPTQSADIEFAENFSALQGRFSYCSNEKELANQLQALFIARNWAKIYCRESPIKQLLTDAGLNLIYYQQLVSCDACLTGCEFLVARTGSIVMSSAQSSGRTTSVYAPVHICIAYTSQMVGGIKEAITDIKTRYDKLPSLITFATGPSRTADIEKTLVVGVHGPKEVFCFLVEDQQ
jgi:L-lactate dehydrogenase complex protein LldG